MPSPHHSTLTQERPRNEGVPGSSPGVGFTKAPLRQGFACPISPTLFLSGQIWKRFGSGWLGQRGLGASETASETRHAYSRSPTASRASAGSS
jgi:hypothetical protein